MGWAFEPARINVRNGIGGLESQPRKEVSLHYCVKEHRVMLIGMLLFVFVLAIFLGVELISKVPSQLHTPLMSGTNAISGITIVGALTAAGSGADLMASILGTLALIFATINVVSGYLVTDRMLAMFKRKDKEERS